MTRGIRRLIWISLVFLLVSLATRVGLAFYSGESFSTHSWGRFLGIGLIFDLAVLPWFMLPWAIYDAVVPKFSQRQLMYRLENRWAAVWGSFYLAMFLIIAASEFAFWTEFGNRFDFIAVDYLVYTQEVIGNIRESYPINFWVSSIVAIAFVLTWFTWPRAGREKPTAWRWRAALAAVVVVLGVVGVFSVDKKLADTKSNAIVEQLSTNGVYDFMHAFRNNELDYEKYYPGLGQDDMNAEIRSLVAEPNTTFSSAKGIERTVAAYRPARKVNVVLISVESLSAEYLAHFGGNQNITPELDKLADKSLFFTKLYATGTRTVRGLEALSVGTPPTPGQSIVRRPNNEGLITLGGELKAQGWTPQWIYGGYGFFDNMNDYFGGNGYTITDRSDVEAEKVEIHHENVWGIADEDLYTLAMAKMDKEFAKGKLFFSHVMTTSNHRPYTFPENRVDEPQKRREGGVKYTDWAIADFLKRAEQKPWFDNTLFIIVADHTSKAAGRLDLPPSRYHIPMWWYAPKLIEPGVMDRLMSQIDVAPTLMGWLGLSYASKFFGYDMNNLEAGRERAFISTYQKLGYMKGDRLVVLDVNKKPVVEAGLAAKDAAAGAPDDNELTREAIAWYQSASQYFQSGALKEAPAAAKAAAN